MHDAALTPSTSDYVAASIFWLYILAALWLTATVIYTILQISPDPSIRRLDQKRGVTILSTAAAISFATLSFNMLNILIQSFLQWHDGPSIELSTLPSTIWRWSLETKPFYSFVLDILSDQVASTWSWVALAATFLIDEYMGVEGKCYGVPRLWAFLGLSQVLPISFASTLFMIALLKNPKRMATVSLPGLAHHGSSLAFFACLLLARRWLADPDTLTVANMRKGSLIMPLVVLARLLLLVPPLVSKSKLSTSFHEGDVFLSPDILAAWMRFLAAGGTALLIYHGREASHFSNMYGLLLNPAVATLGCDFVLALVNCNIWAYGIRHEKTMLLPNPASGVTVLDSQKTLKSAGNEG